MTHRKLLAIVLFSTLSYAAQQPSVEAKQPAKAPPSAEVAPSTEPELDIQQIMKETEHADMRRHKVAIFWWVPPDYWDVALRQQGYNSEQVGQAFQPFRSYNMFIIAVGDLGVGNIAWIKEPEIKKNVLLRDQVGNVYKPMEDIPEDLRSIVELMRPVFKNMMGNFGEGLQFIVFPLKDKAGNVFADARKNSEIYLDVSDLMGTAKSTYTWRFPLTAFMAPKYCSVGKERVEASWKYCPWHGNKLDEVVPAKPAVPAKP